MSSSHLRYTQSDVVFPYPPHPQSFSSMFMLIFVYYYFNASGGRGKYCFTATNRSGFFLISRYYFFIYVFCIMPLFFVNGSNFVAVHYINFCHRCIHEKASLLWLRHACVLQTFHGDRLEEVSGCVVHERGGG